MNTMKVLLPIAILFMLSACQKTLYIAASQVDCTGAADQKCYLIRNGSEGNWVLHYQDFEGLDYTMGYEYKVIEVWRKRTCLFANGIRMLSKAV